MHKRQPELNRLLRDEEIRARLDRLMKERVNSPHFRIAVADDASAQEKTWTSRET